MKNSSRTRKRITAIPRAPDGSAFQTCYLCGVTVAIGLSDMHECDDKRRPKRFRGADEKCYFQSSIFRNEPRSPFRIFMENFWKTCMSEDLYEVEDRGFQEWKNMSKEERGPYVAQANEIDLAYQKDLIKESQDASKDSKEDEEAGSAEVAKFNLYYEYHGEQDFDRFESSSSFGGCSDSWVSDNHDESGSSFH